MSLHFHIDTRTQVDSTNNVVKRALEQDVAEGFVCRSTLQTGGYGRQGRTWSSPKGGSYQSIALRPPLETAQLPTLALAAALAVHDAITAIIITATQNKENPGILIKWPNDIVCTAGKLAGISCEAHAGGICLGIGVNVFPPQNSPLPTPPPSAAGRPAYIATLLDSALQQEQTNDMCMHNALIAEVSDAVLNFLALRYDQWQDGGFAALVNDFNTCSSLYGKQVSIADISGTVLLSGVARHIDEQGRLCVQTATSLVPVSSGEAHLI